MVGGIERGTRSTNRLSDRAIKAFIARARAGAAATKKLSDGGGLYITLTPAGSAVWRVKYRISGKERLFAVGLYPEIGLESARAQREAVKGQLREGRDPVKAQLLSRAKAIVSSASTFRGAAEQWLAKKKKDWSHIHHEKSRQALERDVFPLLGDLPVSEITSPLVAAAVEAIVARGAAETASKILWNVTCVFRFAQARGLCVGNPATAVREILPKKRHHSQRPAILEFKGLRDLLRRAELAPLSPPVRVAHRLIAFTAARIGNAIEAKWKEFDLGGDTPTWTIPRAQMKMQDRLHDHRILLGPTISAELWSWRTITGGHGYVFPSPTGNAHITREAIEKAYRVTLKMNGKHSVHGWRASLSTLARDAGFTREVVELTLDHLHDNAVARAYDRGQRLEDRRRLMYWWDAQLTATGNEDAVISISPAGVA